MYNWRYISLILTIALSLLGNSCNTSTDEVVSEKLSTANATKNLFTASYFLDPNFEELSFPNWFNEKFISTNNIASIKIEEVRLDNDIEGLDSILINNSYSFTFAEMGWVTSFRYKDYHEAVLLTEEIFNYKSSPDTLGFSLPNVNWSKQDQKYESIDGLVGVLQVLSKYSIYSIAHKDSSFIIFQNELHPNRELETYILDPSEWNVVAVDQIVNNFGVNFIHYGIPLKPVQSYKLENLVEKTGLTEYNYLNDSPFLNQITIQNSYTFIEKNIYYDSLGRVDHLQSFTKTKDSSIVEVHQNTFQYNDALLPVKIIYSTGYDVNSLTCKREKIISYTFGKK